jgi:hypothetical protein
MKPAISKMLLGFSFATLGMALYVMIVIVDCIVTDRQWAAGLLLVYVGLPFFAAAFFFVVVPSYVSYRRHGDRREYLSFRVSALSLIIFILGIVLLAVWRGSERSPVG